MSTIEDGRRVRWIMDLEVPDATIVGTEGVEALRNEVRRMEAALVRLSSSLPAGSPGQAMAAEALARGRRPCSVETAVLYEREACARLIEVAADPTTSDPLADQAADAFNGGSHRRSIAERLVSHAATVAAAIRARGGPRETWRHRVRGTSYEVVGHARVQCPADEPLQDDETPLLYRNVADGSYSVRREREFMDGRFERVAKNLGCEYLLASDPGRGVA